MGSRMFLHKVSVTDALDAATNKIDASCLGHFSNEILAYPIGSLAAESKQFDVIILGAGAAGLMCGLTASQRGRRVLLLEHNSEPGRKILISGGGRCNFTNTGTRAENFLSGNPHFAKSALARYQPSDFIALVQKHRIAYHEKKLGQLFCDRSAAEILTMLLAEYQGELRLNCKITAVRRATEFVVESSLGEFSAPCLVVSTGGLSIPKMGATSFAYQLARQFEMKIVETRPGLVPLTFAESDLKKFQTLAGVSMDAIARIGSRTFQESILFTHRGLSGPAVLQISSYWQHASPIRLNLLPGITLEEELLNRKEQGEQSETRTVVSKYLAQRFVDTWFTHQAGSRPLAQAAVKELRAVAAGLQDWQVEPSGTEGFDKAEVTVGGVSTAELSSQTMEAKKVPGLFFIGEAVDVTGHLGGYNFQWAWASGYAAGTSV